LRFGLNLDYKWEQSPEMDAATRGMKEPRKIVDFPGSGFSTKKIGRNQPCPCGSGLKYKKCCLKQ
jgi:uncharacterized protein YecA (UPF0149 family)